MADSKRGTTLTVFAVLFTLGAIQDILKPFRLEGPTTGLVFFGTRLGGTPNAVLGPLVGIFLLVYAAGIWRMRRYAVYVAYGWAIYVTINLLLFSLTNLPPPTEGEIIFGVVFFILALALTWTAAIGLRRRRADLT